MTADTERAAAFSGLVDLVAERVGGRALVANDEFFAAKENLLKPGRGVFIPDKYTDRGKWMDGWESRRRRTPGHDWCLLKLGLPGIIQGVDVDTNHFLGNAPQFASLEACHVAGDPSADMLLDGTTTWTEILPPSALRPGMQNLFAVASERRWTHVRFHIYPDGGVARLRLYGRAVPDWNAIDGLVDLAGVANGGQAVACSDMFFSDMNNLIMPGPSRNMGDGWETKRRRGPGFDWVIIRLGAPGEVRRVSLATTHFKGNYPDSCTLEGCYAPEATAVTVTSRTINWQEVLPQTKLQPDTDHLFVEELGASGPFSHVRLSIYPDGGVARLRLWGERWQ